MLTCARVTPAAKSSDKSVNIFLFIPVIFKMILDK
jgi:hypothetical protein